VTTVFDEKQLWALAFYRKVRGAATAQNSVAIRPSKDLQWQAISRERYYRPRRLGHLENPLWMLILNKAWAAVPLCFWFISNTEVKWMN
jgi:hypothetical protein